MEEKKVFQTDKAAVTGAPYSQAIIHKGIIYVSGMGAVDPQTNEIKLGTIEEEAELALENVRIIGFDVVVNRPKVAAYRAPGGPIAEFAVESVSETPVQSSPVCCSTTPAWVRRISPVPLSRRAS